MRLLKRKKDKTRYPAFYAFTLIEITLAIGIVAIGMAGIMALFPIGFNATRDAIGDNYSSDFADQFLHAFAANAKLSGNWGAVTGLPTSKPSVAATATTKGDTATPFGSSIFPDIHNAVCSPTPSNGYFLEAKSNSITDFSAQILLWKSVPVVGAYDNNATGNFGECTRVGDDDAVPGTVALVRLNMEISWPADKPYSAREKRFYSLEITKPK